MALLGWFSTIFSEFSLSLDASFMTGGAVALLSAIEMAESLIRLAATGFASSVEQGSAQQSVAALRCGILKNVLRCCALRCGNLKNVLRVACFGTLQNALRCCGVALRNFHIIIT